MKPTLRFAALAALLLSAAACAPGYISAKQLDLREQGPTSCKKSCNELEMEMGAFVLVGNQIPGCVCVPKSGKPTASVEGASGGSAGGFVVIAAAAAAHQRQLQMEEERRRRERQDEQQRRSMQH
jgi:hypothetical protein